MAISRCIDLQTWFRAHSKRNRLFIILWKNQLDGSWLNYWNQLIIIWQKSENSATSFSRAFMGIKMTAQLTRVHFRSKLLIVMTSWSKYDVIRKNFILPYSIPNHASKSIKNGQISYKLHFRKKLSHSNHFLKEFPQFNFLTILWNFRANKSPFICLLYTSPSPRD